MLPNQPNPTLTTLTWVSFWLIVMASFCVFLPGFSEFDTSKYLTISQDMMHRNDYMLAFWEGHPYSDKPPLLFWLFIAGWRFFGYSSWWPQLIVLLCAFLSLVVTQRLSLALWPKRREISYIVPFILIGCFYWIWFAKQIRVDSLLVLATLLSIFCLIKTLQGRHGYWLGYALSLGLGGFAKGPVILAFVLLPAIFLPAMTTHTQRFSPKWFVFLGLTTLIGISLPLLWAIPAAIKGGPAFTQEIFYKQISHRQHMNQTSFFFYLVRIPLWLLPWSLYPPVYKNLRRLTLMRPLSSDTACVFVILVGMLAFSLFGQKLPHYIYPLFPFFALLIARLCTNHLPYKTSHQWPMACLTLLFASFCLCFQVISPHLPEKVFIRSYFLQEIDLVRWGGTLLAFSLLLFGMNVRTTTRQIILIALTNVVMALFINNAVLSHYRRHIDAQHVLTALTHRDKPLVASGEFSDRQLSRDLDQAPKLNQAGLQWWRQHPDNRILVTSDPSILRQAKRPLAWYYQSRFSIVSLWTLDKGR